MRKPPSASGSLPFTHHKAGHGPVIVGAPQLVDRPKQVIGGPLVSYAGVGPHGQQATRREVELACLGGSEGGRKEVCGKGQRSRDCWSSTAVAMEVMAKAAVAMVQRQPQQRLRQQIDDSDGNSGSSSDSTCAMVCSSSTACPHAALISSHSTAISDVRPKRKPLMVPNGLQGQQGQQGKQTTRKCHSAPIGANTTFMSHQSDSPCSDPGCPYPMIHQSHSPCSEHAALTP